MAREVAVTFALDAALKGGFKSAFQGAASQARNVASAVRNMEKSPTGKLGAAMLQNREKIKGLSGSLKEAQKTLATLNAQAAASGGGTAMLGRQIELASSKVKNLEGALKRQIGTWKRTTAEAATAGGGVSRLARDYEQLTKKMERAKRASQALHANSAQGEALRAQRSSLHSQLLSAAGTAMTVAAPIMLSIGFEDQMAKVGAVSRASKEDLAALTAQARQLGRDTNFSASQAAEGMQYLAMAGFKTNQIIGAMPGMLNLAAASGTDLGRTADIASNILSAFELKAEQMGTVGDVLTAAFTSSNTTLESLSESMKYAAPVAKNAGATLQETAALAAVLGNIGISGSQAGTATKAIFARLAAPPTEAVKMLDALGISTKDAEGNLLKIPDILQEIMLKTEGWGTADRANVFSKIFGLEPMGAAQALAKQAATTIDENGNQILDRAGKQTTAIGKIIDAYNNSDKVCKQVADDMNATTGGALRRLKSAWEDVGISVGNLFLPTISDVAEGLSAVGNVISGAVERFPVLSRVIAGTVGALASLFVASIGFGLVANVVKSGLNGLRGVFLRVAASQIVTTATTAASGAAFSIAGVGARFFAAGLRSILVATGVGALLVALGYGLMALIDNWDAVVAAMSAAWGWVTDTWGRLGVFFTELGKNLVAIFPGIVQGITDFFKWAKDTVVHTWEEVTGFFTRLWEGITDGASSMWETLTGWASWAFEGVSGIWQGATDFFAGIWECVGASSAWENITLSASWAFDQVSSIWEGATGLFSGIVDRITGIFETFFDWLRENFSWIFDAIDAVSSTVGKITGAVSAAWNKAFGDDDAPAEAAQKSAPVAAKAQEAPVAQAASGVPPRPNVTPVSASAVAAALAGKGKGKSGRAGSGAGSGGSGRKAASGSGGGPVTVVTLAGDNSAPQTLFFPAGGGAASMPAAAAAQAAVQASGVARSQPQAPELAKAAMPAAAASQVSRSLPQAPELAKAVMRRAAKARTPASGSVTVDLTQHFDLIAGDARAVRKVLESIKPDMEALVRRALEKLQSDRSRTAYAQ